VLTAPAVLALVRRHAPDAQTVTGVDESGGEARAYAIDDRLILKTQRPHRLRPRTSLEKEVFVLNYLAAFPGLAVPRVLGYGREDGIEYLCMTRMPGVAARRITIEGELRARLLHDLGRLLRRLHSIPQAPLKDSPLLPGPRTDREVMERLYTGFAEAAAVFSADPSRWPFAVSPHRVADRVLATLPPSLDLVALHSNPGPEHVFVDAESLELTGLIDFGDAYIGHPAFDFRWPSYDDRLAVLAGYQHDAPLGENFLTAWRGTMVFAEMTALATRPDRRQQALAVLGPLLDEVQGGMG
jgi:aminoglycoside phosphotransferase